MIDCSKLKGRMYQICMGVDKDGNPIDVDSQKRMQYLKMAFPEATNEEIVQYIADNEKSKGVGDVVAKAIKYVTFGAVKPCGSCNKRKDFLNSIIPFNNVSEIEIGEECNRNFLMHIWPTKDSSAWRWNCDQVLKYQHLFNSKRVIGIAYGDNTESPDVVKEYLKDFTDDFVVVRNDPKIREGATFLKLLEAVACVCPNEFTFYCHAKGARHKAGFNTEGSTLHMWTEAMYYHCLSNWEIIRRSLEKKAMTGCFKRYGNFKTPGNHRWHYSGSFYWFRNKDVFSRNWNKIDKMFFAVESWPGLLFTSKEVDCLFLDNCGDLYKMDYWKNEVMKKLNKGVLNER